MTQSADNDAPRIDLAAEWARVAETMTPELLAWAEESVALAWADASYVIPPDVT